MALLVAQPIALETRDGPLCFSGWLLATRSSDDGSDNKRANHTELELWRTTENNFVIRRTRVRDNACTVAVQVFQDRREAQEWLGFGALGLALYQAAGWPI